LEPKEEASCGSSTLRLHYFHIRGVAQPVRHLLYHLEVPFEDELHELSKANEMEVGFNVGYPTLEDGEERVHEATAIMVYLCRKFEQCSLLGLTPQSIVLSVIVRRACRR
jgi:glutathione S-transferase